MLLSEHIWLQRASTKHQDPNLYRNEQKNPSQDINTYSRGLEPWDGVPCLYWILKEKMRAKCEATRWIRTLILRTIHCESSAPPTTPSCLPRGPKRCHSILLTFIWNNFVTWPALHRNEWNSYILKLITPLRVCVFLCLPVNFSTFKFNILGVIGRYIVKR